MSAARTQAPLTAPQTERPPPARLYLLTPPAFGLEDFAATLTEALGAGDVAAVQLRLKGCDDETVLRAGRRLKPIVQDSGAAFIVNDRPDLAAKLEADGVHIGQEDGDYATARRLVGDDAIVGVSCHDSRHLAMAAGEKGADYVAFGAFFPTSSKVANAQAGLDILEWWSEIFTLPSVAIGGITALNCTPLVRAGADFLAVMGGVWNHPAGPAAAVRAFNAAIAKAVIASGDEDC